MMIHVRSVRLAALMVAFLITPALVAQSPAPGFSKAFQPATIGPGSGTTLVYTIQNTTGGTLTGLGFDEVLPSGLLVASPARARTTCSNASLVALSGESEISFSGGSVGPQASCTVRVNVRSSDPGLFATTSHLRSSGGQGAPVTAELTVSADRPGFTKTFDPWTTRFGGRSTLILTIDNSRNTAAAPSLTFNDPLPPGMTIADPANLSTTCQGGTLSAPVGGSSISYSPGPISDSVVGAQETCTISVDVRAGAAGWLENTTGELTFRNAQFQQVSSGIAGESLSVTVDRLSLAKDFIADPVASGDNVVVEYTLRNRSREHGATSISFTDDLNAALTGLEAVPTPLSDPCGSGSSVSGQGQISLTGGTLEPGASCTFAVTLHVPSSAPSGVYSHPTGSISAVVDGSPITAPGALEPLFVAPVPRLTKSFTDDPVGAGSPVTLEFTVQNGSLTSEATEISFSDTFDEAIQTASQVPADGFCGAGSTMNFTPAGGFSPASLVVSGASLPAGESCTFAVVLNVVADASAGGYLNTTSEVSALIDGSIITGPPAVDVLEVIGAPVLRKEFVDDPVPAGSTVRLRFTLSHDEFAIAPATSITFTDNLDDTISGLIVQTLPSSEPCGTGSSITGENNLTFSGGSLQPGESCSFEVTLLVPADADPGRHTNTTSNVVADVAGVAALGAPGEDDLRIAGLVLEKSFIDDPAQPGGPVTLEFTITNSSPSTGATEISFRDDLDDTLSGLVASALPADDMCGMGSSMIAVSGQSLLIFSGGSLGPGQFCTFSVTLAVPASAESGSYVNRTSDFIARYGDAVLAFENATDDLEIDAERLQFSKEFLDDPVAPGGTVVLRFAISNTSMHQSLAGITFTDDLGAALPGLVATGLPAAVCGGTLQGTSVLTFSGGSLAPSGSCTFDVTLQVPQSVPLGSVARNVTSPIQATADGLPVHGPAAADQLRINFLLMSKSFDGPVEAGGTAVLTFNIQNVSGSRTAEDLSFGDDLSAVLTGLVATGTPLTDVCGVGSQLSGTSYLTLLGGNLLPGGSCTFSVPLAVPASATPGVYLNTTTVLREASTLAARPASASLTVVGTSDLDRDGVADSEDVCPGTVIPESVPTRELRPNHYALIDGDLTFDSLPSRGTGPDVLIRTEDTGGCSCEQIIEAMELGAGHRKHGCSLGVMREWIAGLE